MTYFLENNNKYNIVSKDALNVTEHLPYGVYTLQTDSFGAFFLEKGANFVLPEKCYGENPILANRIFNTFLDRSSSTGILLSGEKGSGKTLLTKTLSIMGKEYDMPTITINSNYAGAKFSFLIQSIEQPCIVLFDEFEKVYSETHEQEGLLSLLDGVFNSKKLFVFTANDIWNLTKYMFNRPGRIYYHIRYKSLSEQFIQEYCDDKLKDKSKIPEILQLVKTIKIFNFDMLQSLVEELNRYNESVNKAAFYLNIDINNDAELYIVTNFSYKEENISLTWEETEVDFNITNPKSRFEIYFDTPDDIFIVDEDNKKSEKEIDLPQPHENLIVASNNKRSTRTKKLSNGHTQFKQSDIFAVEKNGMILHFKNKDEFMVSLQRIFTSESRNYRDLMF